MSSPHDRLGAKLERVFGALGDWLERVREHEMFRRTESLRRRRAAEARLRTAAATVLTAALVLWLAAATRGRP
jgi:hypothetical protein